MITEQLNRVFLYLLYSCDHLDDETACPLHLDLDNLSEHSICFAVTFLYGVQHSLKKY
jgi:hypothetical protein